MSVAEPTDESPSPIAMPNVSSLRVETSQHLEPHAALDDDRNPVFTSLVTGDGDVVGLVAYSIYKQNKHDWLLAFNKAKNRDPDEREIASYIIGESTPRRLATYRHLAQATLEGKGPDVQVGGAARAEAGRSLLAPSRYDLRRSDQAPWMRAVGYVVTAVVVGVAVLLAVRFGLLPSPH